MLPSVISGGLRGRTHGQKCLGVSLGSGKVVYTDHSQHRTLTQCQRMFHSSKEISQSAPVYGIAVNKAKLRQATHVEPTLLLLSSTSCLTATCESIKILPRGKALETNVNEKQHKACGSSSSFETCRLLSPNPGRVTTEWTKKNMWNKKKKKSGSLYSTQRNVEATITRHDTNSICTGDGRGNSSPEAFLVALLHVIPCPDSPFSRCHTHHCFLEEEPHQSRNEVSKSDLFLKSLHWYKVHGSRNCFDTLTDWDLARRPIRHCLDNCAVQNHHG